MATASGSLDNSTDDGLQERDRHSLSSLELLRRLTSELATLLRGELSLARAELLRSIRSFLASTTAIAVGAVVLYAGMLVLLASAVLGLANVVEPWLAALIVGGVVILIGGGLVFSGLKKMKSTSFKPEQTQENLKRDKAVLARNES